MTDRQEIVAKFTLMGFVLFFVLFFSRPSGQQRAVGLGELVPDFTLPKDDGQPVSLADFRGQIVVLNFWASWCAPCVDELPSLKRFAQQYAGKGVTVLGVSLDEDPEAYKEFLARFQINFLNVRNASRNVSDLYGTFKLPETYIISKDGHLLNKIIGPTDWTSQQMLDYFNALIAAS
ncbi:MAG TPA: TlpA disulfide reductase family protein [Terriglobia bacterium]|nr:TlpA disulfide reductase family protein [Terriglobia bacterium]